MRIDVYEFSGNGMTRVFENEKWMVGIKNWKPENDISGTDCLERHNETDELFVLLHGRCTLLFGVETAGEMVLDVVEMEQGKVYNVPAGLWHNTITEKDTKLILVEDSNTGEANSDVVPLSPEQIVQVKSLV